MDANNNNVNIIVHNDKSVDKKINKTAKRLKKNYEANRKINEKRIKVVKSPLKKAFIIVFDLFTAITVVLCGVIVFASINSKIQKIPPSFAGYSQFKVKTHSMVKSGFHPGDNIVVKNVDVTTLKEGDKIAFYVYEGSYSKFDINTCIRIKNNSETKYSLSFLEFFGVRSREIETAAKANSRLVFHHIVAIYQDKSTNKLWFKTQGSSNNSPDSWCVEDSMVVGIYDDSNVAVFVSGILSKLTSSKNLIALIIVPVILMGIIIILEFLKDVEIAKLELDIVQEKRKLTDEICVKNNVGFNMSKKTKYKVLAQAPDDQKLEYIALLWKNGSAPNAIKKYYIRKEILISVLQKELELHRECDKMFRDRVSEKEIAKFYHSEKDKINKEYNYKRKKLNKIKLNSDCEIK